MREKLINILTKRSVSHGLFWLGLLILLMVLTYEELQPLQSILSITVTLISLSIVIYINLLYLIPTYLRKNKFLTYALSLLILTLLISPIRTVVSYYIYSGYPQVQLGVLRSHWAIFFAMLMIAVLSTLTKMVFDWFQRERMLQLMETETMQSELRFLRAQINPHFLFNTLNSLYALTLKKSDKAPDIVIRLSEMMRYMLYECNDKQVELHKEVDYIKNYLELEKLRHSDAVQINFTIDGDIYDKEIAPLLFSPFLENAFKHGLNKHIEEGFIDVKLQIANKILKFRVRNSKPVEKNINSEMNDKISGGIGLQNVQRRLDLLYPDKHDLELKETDKIYEINLSLELT